MKPILITAITVLMMLGCGHTKKHSNHDSSIEHLRYCISENTNLNYTLALSHKLQGYVLGNGCVDSIKAETPAGDSAILIITDKSVDYYVFYICGEPCADKYKMYPNSQTLDTLWIE